MIEIEVRRGREGKMQKCGGAAKIGDIGMANMKFRKKHVPRRMGDEMTLTPGKTITQTVKRDGERVVIKQTMRADGTVDVKSTKAHTLESDLQAEQVSRLKELADYGSTFLVAGDQNASKRGPVAAAEAKRTGMEAGEPDLRIYARCADGVSRLILIENKNGGGYLSNEQKERHEDLEGLGFRVWVIKTDDKGRAARAAIFILRYEQGMVDDVHFEAYPEISRHVKNNG